MKIEKILVIRETVHLFSIPDESVDIIGPDDGLVSGLLSAISSFSEEIYKEGFHSYMMENHRVTLIKGDNLTIAIFSDKKSLEYIPKIIKDYIFEEIDESNNFESLKSRLKNVFFQEIEPKFQKKGLLITVGRTITPLWFAISQHSPEYATFIVSKETKNYALDLIKFFGYELEINAKVFICDPNDTTSVADAGLKAIDFLHEKGLKNDLHEKKNEILFNSTGGTKGMTIAIAHISFSENIPTYYVRSLQGQRAREDRIFSDEEILLLDNPSDTLGINFEKNAKISFNSLIFLKAAEYFKRLGSVFDANKRLIYRSLHELSLAYKSWSLFNFSQAIHHLENAVKTMKDNLKSNFGRQYQDIFMRIKEQLTIIEKLKKHKLDDFESIDEEILLILYFELINNARRKFEVKKYDDAVCRYYRIFEATAQLVLWKKYKINTTKFDEGVDNLPANIRNMYKLKPLKTPSIILNFISNLFTPASYPPTIALKKSWQLLEKLDSNIRNKKILNKIENVLPIRNLSILAHGWNPIKEKSIKNFETIIPFCIKLVQDAFLNDYPQVLKLEKLLEFVKL
ncbi:MAG: TIGR02710 family CRISPR-associated protein [Candidatus Helarchaeota archaeon]|nr:TIGR02710 family CRISPR-associated protein [Candidatus Helarchaeota archaeon]